MALLLNEDFTKKEVSEFEISVIVPLTDDRGQGLACLKSWTQEQTLARHKFEVIVPVNGRLPELERQVKALLEPQDCLIYYATPNEFLLYDLGARRARGKLLFFTEAHCVPEPECLAGMIQFFATHAVDEARCRSIGVNGSEDFLKAMEERMFEEAFGLALQDGHWLKVLVHGFGIYRELYLADGGFEYEFGQFAEWALAARLHSRGRRLAYADKPAVRHFYRGNLAELFLFVRDFTHGEIGYRARYPADYCERYFGRAPEWVERESYRATIARSLCWAIIKNFLAHPAADLSTEIKSLLRLGPTALFGPAWPRFMAKGVLYLSQAQIWGRRFDPQRCYQVYRKHWEAMIHYCRLEAIAYHLAAETLPGPEIYYYNLADIEPERLIGFHALETWQGHCFRWTEPAALLQISLPVGAYRVKLDILPDHTPYVARRLNLFFDNQPIPAFTVHPNTGSISFQLDPALFQEAALHHLVLLCSPLHPWKFGSPDRRELGLPIKAIEFQPS